MTSEAAPATDQERADAQGAHEDVLKGAEALQKAQKAGKVAVPQLVGYVGFVAPVERNTRILANPDVTDNPVIRLNDQNSPTGKRDTMRENDVWIEFVGGSFITNDPIAIEWCRAHPSICRDVTDPLTSTWAMLKLGQVPLSNRAPSTPSEVDIDRALAGDMTGLGGEDATVAKTREFAEQANEREAVEA